MKKFAIALVGVVLGFATPAIAQDGDFDSREIIPHFTKANLETIVAQLEPTKTAWRQVGDGEESLTATMPSGTIVIIKPSACGSGRCVGLSITALWQKTESQSAADIHERLAVFNDKSVPGATLHEGGVISLTHYVIADYGIPQGNVVVALEVFDSYAQRLAQVID